MNASKVKGSAWERDLREHFRSSGLDVESLRQMGAADEGDIVIRAHESGRRFIIEAKNCRQISLPRFLGEARCEADTYAANRGLGGGEVFPVAVVKARQRPTGEGFAVMRVEDFARLVGSL